MSNSFSAHELLAGYKDRSLSPVEIVEETLVRAERACATLNPFQLIDPSSALSAASAAEKRWAAGAPIGLLDGVPLAIKDLNLVAGWPMLSGSKTVNPEQSWHVDAPSVARLREAGAVIFGKTTTPEFGWKGLTDGPLFGYTRNPWDLARTAGGSSGGAAASVAAGVCAINHASDGGGSIRIPASYCGLFGFKPTFGRVPSYPRNGAYALLSSEGPIARNVKDAALMLQVLVGGDVRDAYALPETDDDYLAVLDDGVAGLRIALSIGLGGAQSQPDIVKSVEAAAQHFATLGATVDVVGPLFEPLRPTFERYWLGGLWQRVAQVPVEQRGLLDEDLLRVASGGQDVTLTEYADAMTARANLIATMNQFHLEYDLLLTPTMPSDPPLAETRYHTEQFDRWDDCVAYTVPFNFTGQPVASIACGLSDAGLPVGLQIIGKRYDDARVLQASAAFETVVPALMIAECHSGGK